MLTRQEQILAGEPLSGAQTFISKNISFGNEAGWVLVVRVVTAPTGTSPTLIGQLFTSVVATPTTFAQVGASLATLTLANTSAVLAFINPATILATTAFLQVQLVVGG